MKTCAKCKMEKEEIDFTPSQLKKNNWCKSCVSLYNKKWAQANPEKIKTNNKKWRKENPEKAAANNKKWQEENPEKHAASNKKWYQNNTEKIKTNNKKWVRENPERNAANKKIWRKKNYKRINANYRNRYQNDLVFRNSKIASGMIRKMLKSQGSSKNGESSNDYFPWTFKEYEIHMESLFEPWMNWKNQGVYDPKTHHLPEMRTWQLDHIIPQSDLPYKTMDHPNFEKAWNLSNLRPLDSKQNIMDGVNRTRHLIGTKK